MTRWMKWLTQRWRSGEVDAIGYAVVLAAVLVVAAVASAVSQFSN